MQKSNISISALFLTGLLLMPGCLELIAPEEFAFNEKCVVYSDSERRGPISNDIGCNGSLSRDGTVTIDIHYINNSQQPLYAYMRDYPADAFSECPLEKEEFDEVSKMPDVGSQLDICGPRIGYKAYGNEIYADHVNFSQYPGRVILKFKQNLTVANRDASGHYNMYVLIFHVGERLYVRDPQTGEKNESASFKVAQYLSQSEFYCTTTDVFFNYYDCGVKGAFVAIPQ